MTPQRGETWVLTYPSALTHPNPNDGAALPMIVDYCRMTAHNGIIDLDVAGCLLRSGNPDNWFIRQAVQVGNGWVSAVDGCTLYQRQTS